MTKQNPSVFLSPNACSELPPAASSCSRDGGRHGLSAHPARAHHSSRHQATECPCDCGLQCELGYNLHRRCQATFQVLLGPLFSEQKPFFDTDLEVLRICCPTLWLCFLVVFRAARPRWLTLVCSSESLRQRGRQGPESLGRQAMWTPTTDEQ